jgi:hypothetical protein
MYEFEFDSNYVYKSDNGTVFPTTLYPEGLTAYIKLTELPPSPYFCEFCM